MRRFRTRLLGCLLLAASGGHLTAAELISMGPSGRSVGGSSIEPTISGDGRMVAFSTTARLLRTDQNSISDVYVYDRVDKVMRQVTDDRGGDQPQISASGRLIVFRAYDDFPKIRLVRLGTEDAPQTVSLTTNNSSFRYADTPTISPTGQFVGFVSRPIPVRGTSDPQVYTFDTTLAPFNASTYLSRNVILGNIGRMVLARNGTTAIFETTDAVLGVDGNNSRDIYSVHRADNIVARLSASQESDGGSARDPVLTLDGTTVFFLSDRPLGNDDDDRRTTIYRSISPDDFNTGIVPVAFSTTVKPVALSRQATSNGQYLVFIGQDKSGARRPYVLEVPTGEVKAVGGSAVSPLGAPVISADNSTIAFATAASSAPGDRNGAADIVVVDNPFDAKIPAPAVQLLTPNGTTTTESSALTFDLAAVSPIGISAAFLEFDGQPVKITPGQGGISQLLSVGKHIVRGVAQNGASVPAMTPPLEIQVLPAQGNIRLGETTNVEKTPLPDGSTRITGKLRIYNGKAQASGPYPLVITQAPAAADWELFGNTDLVPLPPETVLSRTIVPSIGANTSAEVEFDVTYIPAQIVGDGYQGLGWFINARLPDPNAQNGAPDIDQKTLVTLAPRLNDDTPGVNGGIPLFGNVTAGSFAGSVLSSITVQGPVEIAAGATVSFSAVANFNTGARPCRPKWEIISGAGATISPLGVLSTPVSKSTQQYTVRASFGGFSGTKEVTSSPVSPKVSVQGRTAASENGKNGAFRILRTPVISAPLTVNYTLSGKADAGADFVQPGTATIPAGSGAVTVEIAPLDDNFFEGTEDVTLTINPSETYRLTPASSASISILDDEVPNIGFPDVSVRAGGGKPVGVGQQEELVSAPRQRISARAKRNQTKTFQLQIVNVGAQTGDFGLDAARDFVGYKVQYLMNGRNVTDDVVSGDLKLLGLTPGERKTITLKITPTEESPVGTTFRCSFGVFRVNGLQRDYVEVAVSRIK